jgi:hypothetical protein
MVTAVAAETVEIEFCGTAGICKSSAAIANIMTVLYSLI